MVSLGFEPRAAGWKAHTNPLSYDGTPNLHLFLASSIFPQFFFLIPFLYLKQFVTIFLFSTDSHRLYFTLVLPSRLSWVKVSSFYCKYIYISRENTYFVRESIIVWITSSLTGLDKSKQTNKLSHNKAAESKPFNKGGQLYSDTLSYKISE